MKKVFITIIIIFFILGVIILGNFIFKNFQGEILDINIENAELDETQNKNEENIITGTGKFTSFNIEELDTGFWSKIDEVYVKSEEMVQENSKIIKVSNADATGTIYSTISGKFFIEESSGKNKYYIYDLNSVGIEIEVEENDSINLKLGQQANIKFNSITDNFVGRICYISKIPVNGIIKVKISIDYTDKIKFGCIGNVKIDLNAPIDENIKEFDIKNSLKKIGKLKITAKENPTTEIPINIEELMKEYQNDQEIPENLMNEFLEYDTEEISEYYSNLWNEYWKEYWKAYYEEYQTFNIIEPGEEEEIE